jgi:hypothetical protein
VAHGAAVKANAARYPKSKYSYVRELNRLQGKFPLEYPTTLYWFMRSPVMAVVWMIFFAGLAIALVHGTLHQPPGYKTGRVCGIPLRRIRMVRGIARVVTAYSKARNASLDQGSDVFRECLHLS